MQLEFNLEPWLNDYQRSDAPGAAIAILHSGRVLFESTSGLADLQRRIPISTATSFRLASLTKAFTASAILLLVQNGALKLNQSLVEFFPEFPAFAQSITIRHLLQHTSGLPDYELLVPPNFPGQVSDADVAQLLSTIPALLFSPGTRFHYSNSGYVLLSTIVEKASKISFPEFLKWNIFDPLQMRDSVAYVRDSNEIINRAYGYSLKEGAFQLTDQSPTSAVLGDGGIYSSLRDMEKWIFSVASPSSFLSHPERFLPGKLIDGQTVPYGFGWQLNQYRGLETISHSGSTIGFRHFIAHFPAEELSIICLTNRSEPLPHELLDEILESFSSPSPAIKSDATLARSIVGTDPLDPYSP